jgi:hypothetical protein
LAHLILAKKLDNTAGRDAMLNEEEPITGSVGPLWSMHMLPLSQREDDTAGAKATFLSLPQAQRQSLSPSTTWESPSPGTLRYLARQRHRAETQLHLEAAIVQDERGWVALWTRER